MAAPIRVLCVDDEPELAAVVAQFLNDHAEDMSATMASDGEEALKILAGEDIDCVISDYQMPGMDGLELLETIRSSEPEMPFILLTGRGSEDVAGQAVRAGVSDYIPKRTGTDQFELLENRVRNVVERHHARQTTRELFNAATDAILVHDGETGEIVDVNDAATELWGYEAEGMMGMAPAELLEGEEETDWLPSEADPTEPSDWECEDAEGFPFWGEIRIQTARIDGEERILSICRDVTRRKQREQHLGQLLSAAEELIEHRDVAAIGETITRTMTDTLGFRGAVLYADQGEEEFRPVAEAGDVDGDYELEGLTATDLGEDFDENVRRDGGVPVASRSPSGALQYWPLGRHGVLIGSVPEDESSGFTQDLTELLIALGEAALARTLQDRRLEAQHAELESLNHVNEVIRDINQTLVKVSTRDEIEQLVCKHLAAASPYVCAWIGEHDLTAERVDIRLAAGRGAGAVEDDSIATAKDVDDPLGKALETVLAEREVMIIEDLSPESVGDERASMADEHGFESLTVIPITYQNALYDLLAVYAEELQPFGEDEREVLRELGETIGYAMHTAERSRALLSDTTVELEYEIRDDEDVILGLSGHLDTRVELERIFFSADDSARLFLAVEDARFPEVREYVHELRGDADVREISDREDDIMVEIAVEGLPMMKHLAEAMATIRAVEAEGGEGRLVVDIPTAVSVRTLSENLEGVFAHVSLLARRQRDPDDRPLADVSDAADMGLTDRQHEVLLTAYHAGFFSWPRESTGEEIAELLDISQPTFHEHLRTGERKLLELLFEHQRSVYT